MRDFPTSRVVKQGKSLSFLNLGINPISRKLPPGCWRGNDWTWPLQGPGRLVTSLRKIFPSDLRSGRKNLPFQPHSGGWTSGIPQDCRFRVPNWDPGPGILSNPGLRTSIWGPDGLCPVRGLLDPTGGPPGGRNGRFSAKNDHFGRSTPGQNWSFFECFDDPETSPRDPYEHHPYYLDNIDSFPLRSLLGTRWRSKMCVPKCHLKALPGPRWPNGTSVD